MARGIWTVPNEITFLRLGFLPLFIILVHSEYYKWALAVLILAGLTDGIDGLLARRLNQKSSLGAILDPIADKLLLSSSFFVLALKGKLHWWLTILVLSRDVLLLTTAAVIIIVAGYRPFPPSLFGKLTTTAQIVLVFKTHDDSPDCSGVRRGACRRCHPALARAAQPGAHYFCRWAYGLFGTSLQRGDSAPDEQLLTAMKIRSGEVQLVRKYWRSIKAKLATKVRPAIHPSR